MAKVILGLMYRHGRLTLFSFPGYQILLFCQRRKLSFDTPGVGNSKTSLTNRSSPMNPSKKNTCLKISWFFFLVFFNVLIEVHECLYPNQSLFLTKYFSF